MKQIAEFVPIVLFFIVYQLDGQSISLADWTYHFDGIFSATACFNGGHRVAGDLNLRSDAQAGKAPAVVVAGGDWYSVAPH